MFGPAGSVSSSSSSSSSSRRGSDIGSGSSNVSMSPNVSDTFIYENIVVSVVLVGWF